MKIFKYCKIFLVLALFLVSCKKEVKKEIKEYNVSVEFTKGGLKLNNLLVSDEYEYTLKKNVATLQINNENSYILKLTTCDDIAYADGNTPILKGSDSVRRTLKDFETYENMLYFRANNNTAVKGYLEIEPRKENKHTYVYLLVNKNKDRVDPNTGKQKYNDALNKYKDVLDFPKSLKVSGKSINPKDYTIKITNSHIQLDENVLIALKPINNITSEESSLETPIKKKGKWLYYRYNDIYIKINEKLKISDVLKG